jgi:hypothetical protein
LSKIFPIRNDLKQGNILPPLFFKFVLDYATRRVKANQDGLKLNVTHLHLISADDVNILEGSVHTINENKEALLVASKEIRLEVNIDKSRFIFHIPETRM